MKKIDGYWVDENNNKWNCDRYAEEEAQIYSKSCIDCSDCIDCADCTGCGCCRNCTDCTNCSCCGDCEICHHCLYCRCCTNCSWCSDCEICHHCRYCENCNDFAENPQRYTTPRIGSRKANTTIYWVGDYVQVICGCFTGTVDEWEAAIKKTHKDNKQYMDEYMQQVKIVRTLIDANVEGE